VAHKPRILIIGDSISMGYTPHVAEMLTDVAEVVHNPGNAGDTSNTAANLEAWLAEARPGVVHFNCGLHDIKLSRETRAHQVPLAAYRANLEWIVGRLQRSGATLVWASTTPVIEDRHHAAKEFDRCNRDVDNVNAVAAEIMEQAGIPINDLHAAAMSAGLEELLTQDGVHFTDHGYRRLAGVMADCLRKLL
jgi:lysophospholipase L1-like esterase